MLDDSGAAKNFEEISKLMCRSSCTEELLINCTLAGIQHNDKELAAFARAVIKYASSLYIEEDASIDQEGQKCTFSAWTSSSLAFKLCKFARSKTDNVFKKALVQRSTVDQLLHDYWTMHYVSSPNFVHGSPSRSIFSAYGNKELMKMRDEIVASLLHTIAVSSKHILEDWQDGAGNNLLQAFCKAMSIDIQYMHLVQFTDIYQQDDDKASTRLIHTVGSTFNELLKAGVDPKHANNAGETFVDFVGFDTLQCILALKPQYAEEEKEDT